MSTTLEIRHGADEQAWVKITVGELVFWFARRSESKEDRHAVVEYLARALGDQIEEVRNTEYLRGYRDGRRKKAKAPEGFRTLYVPDWMKS